MRLRSAVLAHLALLHLAIAAGGAWCLWDGHRLWILALEAVLILSFLAGLRLVRRWSQPLELLAAGASFLRESDFTHGFVEEGSLELRRVVRLYNDIVQRLRQERVRLQEQHWFLAKVIDASPGGVLTCDLDGRVDLVNPAAERILGLAADDLRGRRLADGDPAALQDLSALKPGESRVVQLRGRHRVKCGRGEFLDHGAPRAFYLLEELTLELRESERAAYAKLIRTLSHELNNSLGASHSILRSLQDFGRRLDGEDAADFERGFAIVLERVEHLNQFMARYAEVVRLPAPSRRAADAGELLETLVQLFQAECSELGILLRAEVEEGLAPLSVDRVQFEQALTNLLRNAIEAVGRDGEILLRASRRRGGRLIDVEDSGPGPDPATRSQLFTPFFSTKPGGQGVGLTLVQEILGGHGFDFRLERVDERTRFRILC